MTFKKSSKKKEIFKLKPRLKHCNLWISDDLTPHGSNIAFAARNAVRNNKIAKTWVYDGKVFILRKGEDKPIRINNVKDIPS